MDHLRLTRRSLLCEDITVPRGTQPDEIESLRAMLASAGAKNAWTARVVESDRPWEPLEVVEESLVQMLSRRPLKTLTASISLREPHKADRVTNRVRRMSFDVRRLGRAAYNRRERANYHKRMPQARDHRRRHPNDESGAKRKAPEKRMGMRLRRR